MAKILEYNATLTERVDLTDMLTLFRVQPDEPPASYPWFVPGQYCVLGMNNEAEPDKGSVRRSMSIASAPEYRGPVEFYIRYVKEPESDNPLTHLMWKLKSGDRLFMRARAAGKFTVQHTVGDDDPRFKIMVAAGTGSAPFVSIVRSEILRDPKADLGKYVILHGASYPSDLGHRDELEELRKNNGLHYYGSVSRPQQALDWQGDSGRVEDYFLADRIGELESRLGLEPGGLTPKNAVILICGLQGTIGMCVTRLLRRGFVPDHRKMRLAFGVPEGAKHTLFFEQYDKTPVIDIKNPDIVAPLHEAMQQAVADGLVQD